MHLWSNCTCSSGFYVSSTKRHSQNDGKFQARRYSTSPLLLCSTVKRKKKVSGLLLFNPNWWCSSDLLFARWFDSHRNNTLATLDSTCCLFTFKQNDKFIKTRSLFATKRSGEARFFELFSFSMLLGKVTYINNTHLSSLCNIIFLIESSCLFSRKS